MLPRTVSARTGIIQEFEERFVSWGAVIQLLKRYATYLSYIRGKDRFQMEPVFMSASTKLFIRKVSFVKKDIIYQ